MAWPVLGIFNILRNASRLVFAQDDSITARQNETVLVEMLVKKIQF